MDNDKLDKTAKAHTDAAAPLMAHTAGKVYTAFHAGANWLLMQPLAERLTEEEMETIKSLYKMAQSNIKPQYLEACLYHVGVADTIKGIFPEIAKEMEE